MKLTCDCGRQREIIETRAGQRTICRPCTADKAKKKREETGVHLFYMKKHRYGLTQDELQEMFEKQDGKCDICGNLPSGNGNQQSLHIDHDHDTGKVRALLCGPCNMGMGQFRESPDLLRAAADYLERHNALQRV